MENSAAFEDELNTIVTDVAKRFGYTTELQNTLIGVVSKLCKDMSKEDKRLYLEVIKKTPIKLVPKNADEETKRELVRKIDEKMLGDINHHIIKKSNKKKLVKPTLTGFKSELVLDNNINPIDRKQYIVLDSIEDKDTTEKDKKYIKLFKTKIDVPGLISALNAAVASEVNGYERKELNSVEVEIIERKGTSRIVKKYTKFDDNTYLEVVMDMSNELLENSINANDVTDGVALYLNIPKEQVKEVYKTAVKPSIYQFLMSDIIDGLMNTIADDINDWRIHDNSEALDKINSLFYKTQRYKDRFELVESVKEREEIYEEFSDETKSVFDKFKDDFFPDYSEMTPMGMIENTLKQCYNTLNNKYKIDLDVYGVWANNITKTGYVLSNQIKALNKVVYK